MAINEKHIIELQGKKFVTYDGLLDEAHQLGLKSIETEMVQYDKACVIFKAVAKTEDKLFVGHGDATPENVNSMIRKHMIRMAETRAKARALRDLTNVGMVAVEELGGDDAPKQQTPKQTPKQAPKQPPLKQLLERMTEAGVDGDQLKAEAVARWNIADAKKLNAEQIAELDAWLIDRMGA